MIFSQKTEAEKHIKSCHEDISSSSERARKGLRGSADAIEITFPRIDSFLMEFIQNADDAKSTSLNIELNKGEPRDEYIIKDVALTGFSNVEEELFGKKWVKEFPFSLETKLKSRGAQFEQTDFMLSKVVVSNNFVTGQNPFSTTKSALFQI